MNREIVHIVITPDERMERTAHATVVDAVAAVQQALEACVVDEQAKDATWHVTVHREVGEPAPRGTEEVQRDIDTVRGRPDKSFDQNIPSTRTRKGSG